jgi:hypothetical protein
MKANKYTADRQRMQRLAEDLQAKRRVASSALSGLDGSLLGKVYEFQVDELMFGQPVELFEQYAEVTAESAKAMAKKGWEGLDRLDSAINEAHAAASRYARLEADEDERIRRQQSQGD